MSHMSMTLCRATWPRVLLLGHEMSQDAGCAQPVQLTACREPGGQAPAELLEEVLQAQQVRDSSS